MRARRAPTPASLQLVGMRMECECEREAETEAEAQRHKRRTGRGRRARGRCRSVRGRARARSARTCGGSSPATGSTPRRTPRAATRGLRTARDEHSGLVDLEAGRGRSLAHASEASVAPPRRSTDAQSRTQPTHPQRFAQWARLTDSLFYIVSRRAPIGYSTRVFDYEYIRSTGTSRTHQIARHKKYRNCTSIRNETFMLPRLD